MDRTMSIMAAAAIGLVVMVGCTHNDYRGHGDRNDRVERDPGTTHRIPEGARQVEEGYRRLDHTARSDGMVYVYDDTVNVIVFDTYLRDGQQIVVDVERNRIAVNGRERSDINLKNSHRFKLFFLKTHR